MAFNDVASSKTRYLKAHTCDHCQKINLCDPKEEIWIPYCSLMSSWDTPKEDYWCLYRREDMSFTGICLNDLEEGSRAGCRLALYLCPRIGEGFPEELGSQELRIYTNGKAFYGFFPLKNLFKSGQEIEFGHVWDKGILSDSRTNHCYVPAPAQCKLPIFDSGIKYRLTVPEGKFTNNSIRMLRPIVADPLDQKTWASIQNWKHKCYRSHEICSLSQPSFFPSRLIHVRHEKLRLIRGESLIGDPKGDSKKTEYTALSYCWGGNVDNSLMTNNLNDYMEEISWSAVPKTVQDAALTTLKLGFRYLWVDSLCIIQDNEADKIKEIGRMAQVYTHSALTIAARRAEDANAGFLHERSLPSGTSTMAFLGEDGQHRQVTLTFESALADEESTRLDTRGWVLQEYLLSRRLLVIGTWVTEWDCRQERQNGQNVDGWTRIAGRDTNPFKYNDTWTGFDDISFLRGNQVLDAIAYLSAHPGNKLPRLDFHVVQRAWKNLVARYTVRLLSKAIDRSVAISALAEMFSSVFEGTKYAAGLWFKDSAMVHSLLWECNATELLPRPVDYQGPSWSWTGIDGSIRFSPNRGILCSEVQSVICEPVSLKAPFGQLKSGTLKIRGPSIELEWRYTRANGGRRRSDGSMLRYFEGSDVYIDPARDHELDAQEADSDWTPVTLLAIYSEGGIIIRENHNGWFSRLGIFKLSDDGLTLPAVEYWMRRDFDII